MASTPQTPPSASQNISENQVSESVQQSGAKELGQEWANPVSGDGKGVNELSTPPTPSTLEADLIKVFGTAELTQGGGQPVSIDQLQRYVSLIREYGIGNLVNGVTYPLRDMPAETVK